MLYESTKTVLKSILKSLQSSDEIGCDHQMELGGECLYEMHQMAHAGYKGYLRPVANCVPILVPVSDRASRAIPHLKIMMKAIRQKDHAGAVQSGRAALAEM